MHLINKSKKLANVCYDIRGPVLERARQMEAEGQKIIKLNIGNVIQVRGEASLFDRARNPGNFDQRAYYQKQGIHVLVWAEEITVRSFRTDRIKEFLSSLRTRWKNTLEEYLGEYYGNTMSAVLLGEKSGLDEEMKKMYQKNGIGHLLAINSTWIELCVLC